MRKPLVIPLGIVAVAPLLLFLAVPFSSGESFRTLATLTVAATLFACAAFIFYVVKTSAVPSDKRSLWLALILFGSLFVLPFFWFQYVWHRQSPASATDA